MLKYIKYIIYNTYLIVKREKYNFNIKSSVNESSIMREACTKPKFYGYYLCKIT